MSNKECKKCIHKAVCKTAESCDGYVSGCKHFKEKKQGFWEKCTDDKFIGYGADGRIRYRKVYSYKCSKCWNYTAIKHNYCPNCGADMRGE